MKCAIPLEYASSILEALSRSNHVVILFDNELKVLCFNEGAKGFFEGYSLEEKSLFDLFPNLDETSVKYHLANDIIYQTIYEVRLSFREGSPFLGRTKYLLFELIPVQTEGGELALLLAHEITPYVEIIETLEQSLRVDKLTGLLNLSSFLEETQRALLAKPRYAGMLVLDLYNFSAINDLYGLEAGDEVLKEVAERLKKAFEASVVLGRTSADEFAIFIPNLEHRKNILQYLDYISLIFEIPFTQMGESFILNYNLGVALYPFDGTSSEILYRHAQAACALAKKRSPNKVQFFDPQISDYLQNELSAERLISEALSNNWFTFFIQPYFYADTLSLAGGETLVRIVKPNGEVLPPGVFIQTLERSIYLESFEKWAFKTIVHLINAFKIPLGLNLYPATFYNKNFFMEREEALQSLSAPLVLEITERATIDDPQRAREVCEFLKNFPMVRLALDDFGTGYSNLSYLKDLPLDVVKIDISFVRALKDGQLKSKQLVKTIIDLAHGLGAKALAEGVETVEQVEILTQFGCDYLQGFYFEKPLPISEFEKKYLSEAKTKA
ncbi:MAG: GGDEF and EAL domain-containing protein [Thermodesulfobacterium sp.]|jgi:diguanylate cyclase (GGDEF)-like protein|nr:GGDEF and EAL domain-containing protein [Thermodesulfobacterium sp.]